MTDQPSSVPPHRSWPRRLLNRLEIDRATFYALFIRGWQLVAGPVTLVLIGAYFPPEIQGWFYVFAELLALQALVEINLQQIVIYLASHEWSRLELAPDGSLTGDADARSRLISLGRFVVRWYLGAAVVYLLTIGLGGALWMSYNAQKDGVNWLAPWLVVSGLSAVSFWTLPLYALLDGCNQVAATYRYRAWQGITGNALVWLCIPLGAGLWTTAAIAAVKLGWDLYPLAGPYRTFFRAFRTQPPGPTISWRRDISPWQWRLALQSGTTALAMSSLTLVTFAYHGEAAAGRMGMTWSALKSLQWGALAWVYTRAPKFGTLIAQGEFAALDRMFHRVLRVSLGVLAVGGACAFGVVWLLNVWPHPLAGRLLPPLPMALLAGCVVLNHLPLSLGIYARAHKREPFLWFTVTSNLALIAAVWLGGRGTAAALGAVAGYLIVLTCFTVPAWVVLWRAHHESWRSAWCVYHKSR